MFRSLFNRKYKVFIQSRNLHCNFIGHSAIAVSILILKAVASYNVDATMGHRWLVVTLDCSLCERSGSNSAVTPGRFVDYEHGCPAKHNILYIGRAVWRNVKNPTEWRGRGERFEKTFWKYAGCSRPPTPVPELVSRWRSRERQRQRAACASHRRGDLSLRVLALSPRSTWNERTQLTLGMTQVWVYLCWLYCLYCLRRPNVSIPLELSTQVIRTDVKRKRNWNELLCFCFYLCFTRACSLIVALFILICTST